MVRDSAETANGTHVQESRPGRVAPSLLSRLRPLRPYVSRRWSAGRRRKVMADTRGVIDRHPELCQALFQRAGVRLIHGALAGGTPYEVRLCHDQHFSGQGDLLLVLRDSWRERPLYTLALCFEHEPGGALRCYIGSARGRENSAAAAELLARSLQGLRPPALLLHVARQLCGRVGATVLLATSNAIHVHPRRRLMGGTRRDRPDHDRLWREMGGWLDDDGWYRLPQQAPRPEHCNIPAPKRAQYERRDRLLDRMDLAMRQALHPAAC